MNKYLKRTFLYCALTLILGFVLGLLSSLIRYPRTAPQVVERVDTVTILKPYAVSETILRKVPVKLQTATREIRIPLDPRITDHPRDTAQMTPDSVVVLIPITQKEYSDSNYRAWVSGFRPSLDSIEIYGRSYHVAAPKPSKLHLTLGVGAVYNGRISPGIFVGVGYSFCEIRL